MSIHKIVDYERQLFAGLSTDTPADPHEGDVWYRMDTSMTFMYNDGRWVYVPEPGGGGPISFTNAYVAFKNGASSAINLSYPSYNVDAQKVTGGYTSINTNATSTARGIWLQGDQIAIHLNRSFSKITYEDTELTFTRTGSSSSYNYVITIPSDLPSGAVLVLVP